LENIYSAPKADLSEVSSFSYDTYEPMFLETSGRLGRIRYLGYGIRNYLLFVLVVVIGAAIGRGSNFVSGVIFAIGGLFFFAMNFVLMVRRLNDLNHTGWLSLLSLIPFVNFFFGLYVLFAPGTEGSNNYGRPATPSKSGAVIVVLALVSIFVIGVLAAVALPAYQDYTKRAKAAQLEQAQPEFSRPNQH
jgi:uncharacterized membrane protein YhaH (DUF805 family)